MATLAILMKLRAKDTLERRTPHGVLSFSAISAAHYLGGQFGRPNLKRHNKSQKAVSRNSVGKVWSQSSPETV